MIKTNEELIEFAVQEEEEPLRVPFYKSRLVMILLLAPALFSFGVLCHKPQGREFYFHLFYLLVGLGYALYYTVFSHNTPDIICISSRIKAVFYDIADAAFTLLIAFIVAFFILDFFRISVVEGESMNRTLQNEQKLLLGVHAYDFEPMQRGDIVVCYASQLNESIIKRLIALPGDHLEIRDNKLYINGKEIKEDYLPEPMVTRSLDIVIPKGKIFVMGDNRNHSGDSRWNAIGLIDIKEDLQGKIIFPTLFGVKSE